MENMIINNFLLSVVHCLQLCFSSCSLIGYYEKWKLNFIAAGLELDHYINYQQWRFSWYSFLSLLDVDYASGSICDIRGQYPAVLSCDATSLGCRKTFCRRTEYLEKPTQTTHWLEDKYLGYVI